MDSVKKTQKRFLDAAKRETRGIIKSTKQITTIPKLEMPKPYHPTSQPKTKRYSLFNLFGGQGAGEKTFMDSLKTIKKIGGKKK